MSSFIGIDVHRDEYHATFQDEEGETVKQGYFQNSPLGFEGFFEGIDEAEVAIEAGAAWQLVYDWLDENGFEVKLAHPNRLRIIAEIKIKTDCLEPFDWKIIVEVFQSVLQGFEPPFDTVPFFPLTIERSNSS